MKNIKDRFSVIKMNINNKYKCKMNNFPTFRALHPLINSCLVNLHIISASNFQARTRQQKSFLTDHLKTCILFVFERLQFRT